MEIDELRDPPKGLRTYATMPELPEAIKLLVSRALVDDIVPQIIQVQCSDDFFTSGQYEVILWGD